MGRILVIYHSQQYGDTKALAEALAEGVRDSGAEVELVSTNERRVTVEDLQDADGVAVGTPDYFSYLAGTIKTFFDDVHQWDKSGAPVKGKPAALFFSHGGGGRVRHPLENLAGRFFEQVGETVESRSPTGEDAKEKCRSLGKELAEVCSSRS